MGYAFAAKLNFGKLHQFRSNCAEICPFLGQIQAGKTIPIRTNQLELKGLLKNSGGKIFETARIYPEGKWKKSRGVDPALR